MNVSKRNSQKMLQIILLAMMLGFTGCDEPVDEVNPYKQEPIAWPSIMDNSASVVQGSPLHNGLYFSKGPREGKLKFEIEKNGQSSFVPVGSESIYTFSALFHYRRFDFSGDILVDTLLNGFTFNPPIPPVLLANGRLAVMLDDELRFIDKNGAVDATCTLPGTSFNTLWNIDKMGNLINITESTGSEKAKLFSISQSAVLNWTFTLPDSIDDILPASLNNILINPNDQSIIVRGGINLFKISSDGELESIVYTGAATMATMDMNGNIYLYQLTSGNLVKYDPDLKLLNQFQIAPFSIHTRRVPSLDIHGNILLCSFNAEIICYSQNGEVLWSFIPPLENPGIESDIITDEDGYVYVAVVDVSTGKSYVNCIDRGESLWHLSLDGLWFDENYLSLHEGVLYFSSYNTLGSLYAVY